MAYVGHTILGNKNIREYLDDRTNASVSFTEDKLQIAEKLEVIHSSFSDPGPDWNAWQLYDANDTTLAIITIDGY